MLSRKILIQKLMAPPRYLDVLILAVFTALITLRPYYMHGKINLFEVGLYLPGIQAILNGEIPFRDFFHLRGPFELYLPAFLMEMFGMHIQVMYAYFYFGNVLCLILCILIAKELFHTRYVLYLMAPVMIGRAFPRVVFAYWGGMRYAWGLLSVWFIIKFFKNNKPVWLFGAGIISVIALLTSVEMGVYPFLGVIAALIVSVVLKLQDLKIIGKGIIYYIVGACLILVPYGIYLAAHSALIPYLDAVWTIVTRMQKVIDPHFVSVYPRNFPEALAAMLNPGHTNFKHMTPSYLYLFILIYLILRLRNKTFTRQHLGVLCLGIYGFIMYNTGFRGIWAAQFEMALQPEKILYFFLLEVFLLTALQRKKEIVPALQTGSPLPWNHRKKLHLYGINVFLFVLLFSSIGYSFQRYNHRFFAFKYVRDKILGKDTAYLKPLSNEPARALSLARAEGVLVPVEQANELEEINRFVQNHVPADELLFTYPDFGTYNFLVNRRFYDKYPLSTFTWFNDRWHSDFLGRIHASKPKHVILQKEIPQYWKDVYLALEPNRQKHRDVLEFIKQYYALESETSLSQIYHLK